MPDRQQTDVGATRRLPQPALVVAVVALVAAITGSAVALPGRNTIDRNDVKLDAIKSKAIKDGQVRGADLAATEPYHVVGAAGEVQFFDGGEGDCVWTHGLTNSEGLAPLSFQKDANGRVHLRGVGMAKDGPGGDGDCDFSAAGESEDGIVFTLPAGYRPEFADLSALAGSVLIAPSQGVVLSGGLPIPGGSVYSTFPQTVAIDGAEYTAATKSATAGGPARVSLRALRSLSQ